MALDTALEVRTLTEHVGAEIEGVDLTGPVDDSIIDAVRSALDQHSVLVFRAQHFDDETQTAFSARFGDLERTVYKPEGDGGVPVANITNVDFRTGRKFPPGHPRLRSNSGNEMWHTDSSFKPVPAYCSMLSGREVPPVGGDTEFASCRAAYDRLTDAERLGLEGLVAVHDYAYSRSLVDGYQAPEQTLREVPPVRHAVVRTNPATGRRNYYTGSHASHIIDRPIQEGRHLLRELVEKATQRSLVYVHRWRPLDFVIWDNRCVLHRGTRTTAPGIGA